MEECMMKKLFLNTNRHGRKWECRKTRLAFCQDEHCKIISSSFVFHETKLQTIPGFNCMSCFEIDNIPQCHNLIVLVEMTGK